MSDGDVYKVLIVWSNVVTAKNETVGLYVQQNGGLGFDVNDAGDAVKAWWNTELNSSGLGAGQKAIHPDSISLDHVELRKWDPLDPIVDSYTTGLPIAGSDVTDPLPGENAILVSLRTGKIGRRYRGRVYLPPCGEDQQDGNVLATPADRIAKQFIGLLQGFEEMGLGGHQPVVYSAGPYKDDDPPTPIGATPITSVRVDEHIRSQRRRNMRAPIYQIENL